MVYSQYKQKLEKTVKVLNVFWRFRYLILLEVIAVIVLILALCGISGNVYGEVCPSSVEYGTPLGFSAKAIMASVTAEYSEDGKNWSEDEPTAVGTYYVRARSRGAFGVKYGSEFEYDVTVCNTALAFTGDKFEYGDDPETTAALAYSDEIAEVEYEYSYVGDNAYRVTATAVSIVDGGGRDVSSNYNITSAAGTLTCVPREVTISTEGGSKTYDGISFSVKSYEITKGSLLDGEKISVTYSGFTDAGMYDNMPEVTICDSDGSDVTYNYNLTYDCGTIEILQREITISTGSGSKTYDGKAFSVKSYELTEGSVVSGHKISLTYDEFIDAGTHENTPEVKIIDVIDDVSANYSVTIESGTITILKRAITVYTASATWVYDGLGHSAATDYGVSSGSAYKLVSGHTLSPTAASVSANTITEITDNDTAVGYEDNALEFNVKDSSGNDVTANYDISYVYGKLRVKTPIIISLYNYSKTYNGTPLEFKGGYEVSKKPPDVTVSSVSISTKSITNVGTVLSDEFEIESITITDASNSVNESKIESGVVVLEVKARVIEITSVSVEKEYAGASLTDDTYWISLGSLVSDHNIEVTVTGELTTSQSSAVNTISNVVIYDSSGNIVTSNYSITYNEGTLSWLQ